MPSSPRPACALLAVVLAAGAFVGCGAGSATPSGRLVATAPTRPAAPNAIPPGVPRQGTAPAVPAERRVIDRWLRTLRSGDEVGAARFFAPGATVQNASPVFRVRSLAERTQFMRVLTCGAIDRDAVAGGRHFTIVTFLLTERPKGDCGTGTGHVARAAIRVEGGRITGWFRLPGGNYTDDAGPQVIA